MATCSVQALSEDPQHLGTHIYCLNGTDPEGHEVRYGLTFDPGSAQYFSVDPESGNITLVERLDREDGGGNFNGREQFLSSSASLTVNVLDQQDTPPAFLATPYFGFVYEVSVPVRDDGVFGINETDGRLTLLTHPSNLKREIFNVRVRASEVGPDGRALPDSGSTATVVVTIRVVDLNNNPPRFYGDQGPQNTFQLTMYEHPPEGEILRGLKVTVNDSDQGSEVFTVLARDGDAGNPNPVVYSLDDGDDGVFGINETDGRLTLLTHPSNLKREIFNVRVRASEVGPDGRALPDSGSTATVVVTIRVVDLNNNPPRFYGDQGPQNTFQLTMYEHPPEGEILRGLKVTVNDSDQGANAKFNLRLIGPGRMLRVVPQTVLNEAQVTILVDDSSAMDYEKYHFLTYKLLAVEVDTPERFSATADIIIHLLDTNDNAPRFSSDFYVARIPENSPGGSNVVSVTPTSGIIYTQPWASLDAEVRSKYNFYVKAEDTEGKYSLAEVFVTVLDLNDHSPEFNGNLLEKTMVIGAAVKIQAVDNDAEEPNNVIEYSIMKADPDNIFDINTSTGEIVLKSYVKSMAIVQNITQQRDCTWSVVVQARDQGQPSFSTTAVVKIDITEATQLVGGPLAALLLQSRDKPLYVLAALGGVISLLVVVTVTVSTATFLRNKKSNRVLPHRHVRRRPRTRPRSTWTLPRPFGRGRGRGRGDAGDKSGVSEVEKVTVEPVEPVENVNYNNNVTGGGAAVGVFRPQPPPPPPPCAPAPPPPPGWGYRVPRERAPWTVTSVSGAVAAKAKRIQRSKEDLMNSALVSELKMKLEQKRLQNLY
ncbi:hypothetical protein CRUP_008441 [Coryphaenoides rupestris]|nr:hypothetical protein CRUP_008441 [Coryphaenoides rupestris]